MHSLPPELEEEEDPVFFFLSFFPFNEETVLASCCGLEFLDEAQEGERWLEGRFRICSFASW
jgi:hypothetical protein